MSYCQSCADLQRELEQVRASAITGWETARCLAIMPPSFPAPASEEAADKALALLRKPDGEAAK